MSSHNMCYPFFPILSIRLIIVETNLLKMLETTADSCDSGITFLEDSQQLLEDVSTLLINLRNFGTNVKTLSSNAERLHQFIRKFWGALKTLAGFSVGPLAAIKTIVSVIKVPVQIILKALNTGAKKINSLAVNVENKLNALVTKAMIEKINDVSIIVGKPKTALEKVAEIVDMLISVASLGVLPMSLISEFASSDSLRSFFETLSNKIGIVKSTLGNLCEQTNLIQPYLNQMRELSNNVASKFNFIRPLDIGLKKLQPYVDTIQGLTRRFTGWYSYLLAGMMWPVEQTINLLLRPFRSQINRMIAQLNPFKRIDALIVPLVAPLRDIIDEVRLKAQLDFLGYIQDMSDSTEFKEMAHYFCLAVA